MKLKRMIGAFAIALAAALVLALPVRATEVVYEGTCGTCTWTIDEEGLLRVFPTEGESGELVKDPDAAASGFDWAEYADDIKSAVFDDGVWAADMSELLAGCACLTEADLRGLSTSAVTAADNVFDGCDSLESIAVGVDFVLPEDSAGPDGEWWSTTDESVYSGSEVVHRGVADLYLRTIDIAQATVSEIADQVFTGDAIEPQVTVTLGDQTLEEETDYTVAFADNTDAGTATVTITGQGRYTGTTEATFVIAAASIEDAVVTAEDTVYSGAAQEPEVTVTLGEATLEATDYDVTYSDNTDAGTATITITGKGNYAGTATGTFSIEPADIADAVVTAADQVYTGEALEPEPTVTLGDVTLVADTDYDVAYSKNTEIGIATIIVLGRGNYTGTATGTFDITEFPKVDIADAVVAADDVTYNGEAQTPEVTVTLDDVELVAGTDYEVTYADNTDAGTATVTVAGKGNYTGTASGTFTIAPAAIDDAVVTAPDQTYTGSALTPEPTVTLGDVTLEAETDYDVAYSKNKEIGTATVIVLGRGNYTGIATGTFAIIEKPTVDLSDAVVTADDVTYTGEAQEPEVTVTLDDVTLTADDYDVAYADNTDAGTATITVTGKGDYTGTATGTFTIAKANISAATVTADDQIYTGEALTPEPTVVFGDITLEAGKDYDVTYTKNTEIGTATVVVLGQGNFTGVATGTFAIIEKVEIDITDAVVTASDVTYTGEPQTPEVTVTLGDVTLTADDYDVDYADNTEVGTATVIVTGKGDYTGSATGSFEILAQAPVKTGWQRDADGDWNFYGDDGQPMCDHWERYNGVWYYFGADGKLVWNGWAYLGDDVYYMGSNGQAVHNTWVFADGAYYYIGSDYKLVRGGWATYGGKYYYLGEDGTPQENGWVYYGGKYYCLRNYNPIVNGWVHYQGVYYHFNASGVCDNTWVG